MLNKFKKALQHLNHAEFQQSIAILQKKLSKQNSEQSPNYNKYVLHLTVAYIQISQPQKSQKLCEQLLSISPYQEQAYVYLALALGQSLEYQHALQICNQGISLNEKNWKLYYAKGYILYQKADYEDASQCLGYAITKNRNNNPKSYILQAACFASLFDLENAKKNIGYAQMAMGEDKKKNCEDLYEYEVKNIQQGLRIYQKYQKKLKKSQQISSSEKQKIEIEIIKIINKSIAYGESKKNNNSFVDEMPKPKCIEKEENSQISKNDRNVSIHGQLQKIENIFLLKSKNSIRTESFQNDEIPPQKNTICEWLKQKCSIY